MILPALSGFVLSGSLIIAIGAQNAYILRMGLAQHHVFWLCLFCAVSDAVLIILGVAGLGALVEANPGTLNIFALGGALFLFSYAALAFKRALNPAAMQLENGSKPSLLKALSTCAAFTWLNPHVYLDTVMLIGAYAAQYAPVERMAYGAGAVLASFVWFFALGYGAQLLAPVFSRRAAWQALDIAIAVIMAVLAASLLRQVF
ncbi:LysE/ArgO family amino acid transporter [Salaquimonas pukyongi]|uniref:LysE/ArgO family amino acid transporter n=1 Tax=Salaquimonas pukyongi TaxID=2712698 RepID=UPI00096BBA1D|nr:LysE/ArgO family amino acid transporter [Salaquimonas pukyongi]